MNTLRHILLSGILAVVATAGFASPPEVDLQESEPSTLTYNIATPTIKVLRGAIEVYQPADGTLEVTVYALTGRIVANGDVPPGESVVIELPPGYYIVKAGHTSQRVAVK